MRHLKNILGIYLFSLAVFIPFYFHLFPYQKKISQFIFGDISYFIASDIFGLQNIEKGITSDSFLMYVLYGILLLLSVFIYAVISKYKKGYLYSFISVTLNYYLSLQLIKYGCYKLFKSQFYLPEPNILYTPLGQLDQDILFWSTMGVNYPYNIFMGLLEVIPGLLLLHKKTRLIGVVLAMPVLLNIVAINFSFDISVKLYSFFLFFMSCYLFIPWLKSFLQFFNKEEKIKYPKFSVLLGGYPFLRNSLKCFALLFIVVESIYPNITQGNINDDIAVRPYLHGAYEVVQVQRGDSIIPSDSLGWKRIFLHRDDYFIVQKMNDGMQDFKMRIDANQNIILLTDYQLNEKRIPFSYDTKASELNLEFPLGNSVIEIQTEAINWKENPALKNRFHWYIEQVE